MLLEKQARDTANSSTMSLSCKREDSNCYEMPEECFMSDEDNIDDNRVDDSDGHQLVHENLRLQRERPPTYQQTPYRNRRQTATEEESQSFSPPSPVPQTPTEKNFQLDKQMYETTSRKRYHTSPHDKNKVNKFSIFRTVAVLNVINSPLY